MGESLSPIDVVRYTAAYAAWIKQQYPNNRHVVVGRDARISGDMMRRLVVGTLQSMGIDVTDLDLACTPTVEIAVIAEKAAGGIILSASHNPKNWNALKLLNHLGEFLSDTEGKQILDLAQKADFSFAEVEQLGKYTVKHTEYLHEHIRQILALQLVDAPAIKKRNFKILVDGINSVGGIALPALLRALGVQQIVELHCKPDGNFAHNPEPLPEHLQSVALELKRQGCDLGIVLDPDADRLAFICEDATMFGEEYTLVAVADYVLQHTPGCTVSNLSSTRALRDVAQWHQQTHHAAAVGEVNVVVKMKETGAVIGGEGNGGIIYPALHYGRDALVGVALFLSHLAHFGKACSALRSRYPNYVLVKNKAELPATAKLDDILHKIQAKYKHQPMNTIDGLRLEFDSDWIHLRKSNTEPIMRIYAESASEVTARTMIKQILYDIKYFSS